MTRKHDNIFGTIFRMILPLLLLMPFLLASCSEEDNEVEEYVNWQQTNQQYWDSLFTATSSNIANGDSTWKIIKNWSYIPDSTNSITDNTQYIIVHVLNEGTGSGSPLYTDSVRCHYYGQLLPSVSYPSGYVFDSSYSSTDYDISTSAPAQFLVSNLVDGFATALQHMHIGDQWDVYIPWTLAYGEDGSSSIPGYSVLRFNIILVSYYRAGTEVPDFRAKKHWIVLGDSESE
ncbi:MAG: FKBP-type peptidyl-prolyl cis-trans isomerase [Prevotella sp.]|jgi:FKBP-type peptidyl-prolyl cis-trans isomerase FklB